MESQSPSPLAFEINPKHLHSRTRKRFRDNRPDAESIGKKTIGLLYEGQKKGQDDFDCTIRQPSSSFTPPLFEINNLPESEDQDMVLDTTEREREMDNIMIDSAPHTSLDDRMRQSNLPFATNISSLPRHQRTPSLASTTMSTISQTSPFSQPVRKSTEKQKTLDSFFGAGGKSSGPSSNPPTTIKKPQAQTWCNGIPVYNSNDPNALRWNPSSSTHDSTSIGPAAATATPTSEYQQSQSISMDVDMSGATAPPVIGMSLPVGGEQRSWVGNNVGWI